MTNLPTVLTGRAFVFGANVTTDDILPGKYLDRSAEEVGPFAMSGLDATFSSRVRPGDIVMAGPNFGMGSGRESAPGALKRAGVGAVVALSFGRLFYRNAINLGLPAVLVESIEGIREGDALRVDLERRVLFVGEGLERPILNLTGTARAILEAGGIVPYTKRRLGCPTP